MPCRAARLPRPEVALGQPPRLRNRECSRSSAVPTSVMTGRDRSADLPHRRARTRACSQAGRQPLLDRVVAFLGMAAAAVLPRQRNPHLVEFELGAKLLDGLMIRIVACHGSIAGVCHQATPTPNCMLARWYDSTAARSIAHTTAEQRDELGRSVAVREDLVLADRC